MASVEDNLRIVDSFLTEHAAPLAAPVTVQGTIDLFGGGREGRDILAHRLAAEQLAAGKTYKHGEKGALAAARRNIQRYTTEASEKRTPKQLQEALSRIAESEAARVNTERVLDQGREFGGFAFTMDAWVLISKDERQRHIEVTLTPEDMRPIVEAMQRREWLRAGDEYSYAILQAYDLGRGNITGYGGVITDIDLDTFDVGYGTEI